MAELNAEMILNGTQNALAQNQQSFAAGQGAVENAQSIAQNAMHIGQEKQQVDDQRKVNQVVNSLPANTSMEDTVNALRTAGVSASTQLAYQQAHLAIENANTAHQMAMQKLAVGVLDMDQMQSQVAQNFIERYGFTANNIVQAYDATSKTNPVKAKT